jgi:hypothetical protein
VLPLIAQLDMYAGDLLAARAKLERAASLIEELGTNDSDDQMFIELRLADVFVRLGDADAGRAHIARSDGFATRTGAPEWLAILAAMRGAFEADAGNLEEAQRLQGEAEGYFDGRGELTFPLDHGIALVGALGAQLDIKLGRPDEAAKRLLRSWPAAVSSRDKPIVSTVTVALAGTYAQLEQPEVAAELMGLAARLRGAEDPTNPTIAVTVADLVERLGAAAYQQLWSDGFARSGAEAMERTAELLTAL